MPIAFATSRDHRGVDADLPLLEAAARQRGVAAEIAVWDDDTVDWEAFEVVVVRSCWDYIDRRDAFLAWAASLRHVVNPVDVLAWNTDKVYLRELDQGGVPVIDTRWNIRTGHDLPDSPEWVVKPAISAGSRDTARWSSPDDVYRHSEELLAAGRTVMVQPYVDSVDTDGETALIYLGGRFSHAIRKGPLLGRGEGVRQDRDQLEIITPRAPTAAQLDVAQHVLDAIPPAVSGDSAMTYARVDLVTDHDGAPRLIELELTEPSLFLDKSENGAELLVDAVTARLD